VRVRVYACACPCPCAWSGIERAARAGARTRISGARHAAAPPEAERSACLRQHLCPRAGVRAWERAGVNTDSPSGHACGRAAQERVCLCRFLCLVFLWVWVSESACASSCARVFARVIADRRLIAAHASALPCSHGGRTFGPGSQLSRAGPGLGLVRPGPSGFDCHRRRMPSSFRVKLPHHHDDPE
jgi:hypothetical protein